MNGNRCWHALLYLQGSPSGGRGSLRLDGRNYCKCAKDRRAWSRHCLWFYQSSNSIQWVLLGAEKSVCKEKWLCNSFNSLENAVPLYVCLQDKGEGCLACFTEWIWSDLNSKGFWATPIPIYFHVTWAHLGLCGWCLA